MKGLSYAVLDVFTQEALAGNPLAIVFDADGMDAEKRQAIAREFNLSETVFVSRPVDAAHTARIHIHTPVRELPFAGHPTVGTAVALASRDNNLEAAARMIVLEENIGPVRCAVHGGSVPYAEFDLPQLPLPITAEMDFADAAAVFGLDPQDFGFENHVASAFTAGVPMLFIPVRGLEAMRRVAFDPNLWRRIVPDQNGVSLSAYLYCRETVRHDSAFHARMFSSNVGGREDPATGSAVAAFAGTVHRFDGLAEGPNEYWVEQGVEMQRPSRIRLEITGRAGAIQAARIGGHAVRIAEGTLFA